ncbi:Sau3AI family type II restriction endonuclease [Tenacibaculum mesophilum]|uniref:DNA mismatch repair protein n=1 Tax=Tenacibaculum mesophilum TaxID=104268 RepID=A0ABM7CJ89_9FLAO|nr:Sau3AI family type II restriction endonuclease [Tenacibaculum mesophilum]AZJ33901.1 DNA mismatch repair protein [Tenacibaculum mesophilum]QFS27067.1 DNA mismatch repair protein [Tenacibaculum mesophilum]
MNKGYNIYSAKSIINFAKKLKAQSLRQACGSEIEKHGYKGKGNFGQILEKFYFGYEPNSDAEPDFKEAGIELKSSPLKILKNKEYRSKERLVLNIINYLEVHKENFENSSFWKKNAHLLLVFYLHDKDLDLLDYIIKLVDDWKYPNEDLKIIKHDWETINQKIKDGKAHELSEGDTFYLGACTKGSTALKSYRDQPFNKEKAKQRAYSLKQGYVNHIIANIAQEETAVYGKIIEQPEILDVLQSIEDVVISKFQPFYGKSAEQIEQELGLELNSKAKSYFANLTNAILGLKLGQKIEEFEKADIQVKTIRLKENNLPKEDISFPTFEYQKLIETDWEDSDFKNILESKFFFVFYQFEGDNLILRKVKFWNMSYSDIIEAKSVWDKMKTTISKGKIVKEVTNKGIRKTYFPKKTENRISHVRPHARNADDTYNLPVADKLTGLIEFTKHCFWLNASYVKDEIYGK